MIILHRNDHNHASNAPNHLLKIISKLRRRKLNTTKEFDGLNLHLKRIYMNILKSNPDKTRIETYEP